MTTQAALGFSRLAVFAAAMVACAAASPPASAAGTADSSSEIVVQALALLGVPYRWGGEDPARGLDCSGLVRHVFKTVVSLDLPRRSQEMSRLGYRVTRADLRAGDLLFFNTLGYPNSHVALYVGGGRFVHAPGRNSQVRIDGLDDHYWSGRFNEARRIEFAASTVAREAHVAVPRVWKDDDFPEGP
ncbi:MAG TPA: C40 family peptidase [Burkholderiaceae bacterium]|nr:C40 family peptidase [Burkholderiaceae bacterium]